MDLNKFQLRVLNRCCLGHLPSSRLKDFLEWQPENAPSDLLSILGSTRAEVTKSCQDFSGDMSPLITVLERFARKSKDKTLKDALLYISKDLQSTYTKKNVFQKTRSIQKQKEYLQRNINERLNRIEEELLKKHVERRQNEYMRRAMKSLVSSGFIDEHSLPFQLRNNQGKTVFCLTKRGAAFVANNIPIPHPDRIRVLKFNANTSKHEIMVSEVINLLVTRQSKDGYVLDSFIDESMMRSLLKKDVRKLKHLVDLRISIEFNNTYSEFFVEIDNGSQPPEVFDFRAATYPNLIYICSTEERAKKLQLQLHLSRTKPVPVLITTFSRFMAKGLWGAGYLSKFKDDFCKCKKLVTFDVSKKFYILDRSGCPCILRNFISANEVKTKKTIKPPNNPPLAKPSKPLYQTRPPIPQRRPLTFWEMSLWQMVKYIWRLFKF